MNLRRLLAASPAALIISLAACGQSAPSTAPVASTSAGASAPASTDVPTPASLDQLYAAAKAEGAVTWEAAPIKQAADELGSAFAKKYPGIKVTYSATSDPQLPTQIITEVSAGSHKVLSIDLAHGGPSLFKPLTDRDLLLPTDWTKLGIDSSQFQLNGRWLINEDGIPVIQYNTTQVQPSDVPQQWSDLLKPRWAGRKIAENAGPDTLAQLFFTMGEDQARTFLTSLKGQQLVITKSKGPAREMVSSGQAQIGATTVDEIVRGKASGIPVEVAPLGPMLHDLRGWYIPKAVQHPNAARLLAAWLISPEGLALQAKAGVSKVTPCSVSDIAQYVCDRGIKYIDPQSQGMDPVTFYNKIADYQQLAGQLIGADPTKGDE